MIGLTDQSDYSICHFMVKIFIRTVYTKIRTLCVKKISIEFVKLAEGGGTFLYPKKSALSVTFLYKKKQCTFRYVFRYKNPDTLCYIFICKKHCTLRCVFISKIYCKVLIPNYKRTYNQFDQIEE